MGSWSQECCTMREIFRQLIAGLRTDEFVAFDCSALSVKLNPLSSLGCSTLCIPNCLVCEIVLNNQGGLVSVVRFRDWLPNLFYLNQVDRRKGLHSEAFFFACSVNFLTNSTGNPCGHLRSTAPISFFLPVFTGDDALALYQTPLHWSSSCRIVLLSSPTLPSKAFVQTG
jgi:hypothetical protein